MADTDATKPTPKEWILSHWDTMDGKKIAHVLKKFWAMRFRERREKYKWQVNAFKGL